MSSPLPKKLGMKPGKRALILSAPAVYLASLKPLPHNFTIATKGPGVYDLVQVFATELSQVSKFARSLPKIAAPNALVWISYPKQTSKLETDLNRNIVWTEMNRFGWRGVSIIAVDETWSALRVRPANLVRSKSRRR